MTTIRIFRTEGHITAVTVEGHTGYAEEGSDIVCAAVSALTQGALLGIREVAGIGAESRVSDGRLTFRLKEHNEKSDAILETMRLALLDVTKGYPRYIRMED
ncbi:MAG: ribosomal-processing cysteine protease Prp [Firmicutes bacterium]|uniref:Ribosomal processing cysteine protease Prp n=1 Tax=Candidatus Stercoripulliclostridium pullicola TaxID=2840953 RepID=A0A940ID85_9FIRM|nr:ribosomal-processing cysteine protease Prp [Candidatus Stercoripulliclostridium pullicola]